MVVRPHRIICRSKSTVFNILRKKEEFGTSENRPRMGRPRATTPSQDKFIRVASLKDRFRPAHDISRNVIAHTTRNAKLADGLYKGGYKKLVYQGGLREQSQNLPKSRNKLDLGGQSNTEHGPPRIGKRFYGPMNLRSICLSKGPRCGFGAESGRRMSHAACNLV